LPVLTTHKEADVSLQREGYSTDSAASSKTHHHQAALTDTANECERKQLQGSPYC
jgi:hypothetical protein